MGWPETPKLVVDCVVIDAASRVLLIRRGTPPYQGKLALPGGFVDVGETVEDACRRELKEETGVEAEALTLVGVYSDPTRDPRGHTVSVAFLTEIATAKAKAGDDAAEVVWVDDATGLDLAFDHSQILDDAMDIARPDVTMIP